MELWVFFSGKFVEVRPAASTHWIPPAVDRLLPVFINWSCLQRYSFLELVEGWEGRVCFCPFALYSWGPCTQEETSSSEDVVPTPETLRTCFFLSFWKFLFISSSVSSNFFDIFFEKVSLVWRFGSQLCFNLIFGPLMKSFLFCICLAFYLSSIFGFEFIFIFKFFYLLLPIVNVYSVFSDYSWNF